MKSIAAVGVVGVLSGFCGVACGDGEADVTEKVGAGGRASSSNTGGAPDTGGSAPLGGVAAGGSASGGVVTATFGGFEAGAGRSAEGGSTPAPSGGRAANGGSRSAETGGAGSGECEPMPVPESLVFDGDFEVANAEDIEEARKYTEITGALQISVAELELPMLARIGGDLSSSGTTSVRLPALTEVGGSIYYYLDEAIEVLDLRNLRSVGDQFWVHRNLALRELQIDALVEVGTDFQVSANLKLPDCFLEVVDTRLPVLHTMAPEGCTCTRSCGAVSVACE